MNENTLFAPVALFVYNRLDVTRKTVEALQKNRLAPETDLYIFSDGGRDEASWKLVHDLRKYLYTISGFKTIHIIERPYNFYLEGNIISGINEVVSEWGRVIVVEDDICTSPYFLKYMNDALNLYAEHKEVMHISGFTRMHIPDKGDTHFTPYLSVYGWATWKDRWQYFVHYKSREEALSGLTPEDLDKLQYGGTNPSLQFLDLNPIPWDICWQLAVYRRKGLCLAPTQTLTRNTGLYSGTHFKSYNKFLGRYNYDRPYVTREMKVDDLCIMPDPEIEAMYPGTFEGHGFEYNLLGRFLRYFYLRLFKR
ncbi:MAG: glycosyltransferase [Tannerellaceae bacterium]|nr:glycosyltransferase [Tannerellaceae bacterium]